jgi:hypothetical protein
MKTRVAHAAVGNGSATPRTRKAISRQPKRALSIPPVRVLTDTRLTGLFIRIALVIKEAPLGLPSPRATPLPPARRVFAVRADEGVDFGHFSTSIAVSI